MKCVSCGIKSEKQFCSERCEKWGRRGDFNANKKPRKYPYNEQCKCGKSYLRRSSGHFLCDDCYVESRKTKEKTVVYK